MRMRYTVPQANNICTLSGNISNTFEALDPHIHTFVPCWMPKPLLPRNVSELFCPSPHMVVHSLSLTRVCPLSMSVCLSMSVYVCLSVSFSLSRTHAKIVCGHCVITLLILNWTLFIFEWYTASLLVLFCATEDGWMMKQALFQNHYKMVDCQWWQCAMLSGECRDDMDMISCAHVW